MLLAIVAAATPSIGSCSTTVSNALPSWVSPSAVAAISEPQAVAALSSMQSIELSLPSEVSTGPVTMTYLRTKPSSKPSDAPMLLVHGFDISCLEYRRLLPLLEAEGIEAYAPCVPGWGFTDTANMRSVGVEAKRAALLAFHDQVLDGRPAVWVGASLGACMCLDVYCAKPAAVSKLASLDPGFFTPAPPAVPPFVGRLLLQNVLSAPAVRRSIAKQAYCEKDAQTEDAIAVGNLHIARAEWEDDSLEWLLGGAYGELGPSVPTADAIPTLTLWGREDEVIPPEGFGAWPAAQTVKALPSGEFRWVECSGHTPHLEQPAVTAAALAAFSRGEPIEGDATVPSAAEATLAAARELAEAAAVAAAELVEAVSKSGPSRERP